MALLQLLDRPREGNPVTLRVSEQDEADNGIERLLVDPEGPAGIGQSYSDRHLIVDTSHISMIYTTRGMTKPQPIEESRRR
jgi:hypothetical protein